MSFQRKASCKHIHTLLLSFECSSSSKIQAKALSWPTTLLSGPCEHFGALVSEGLIWLSLGSLFFPLDLSWFSIQIRAEASVVLISGLIQFPFTFYDAGGTSQEVDKQNGCTFSVSEVPRNFLWCSQALCACLDPSAISSVVFLPYVCKRNGVKFLRLCFSGNIKNCHWNPFLDLHCYMWVGSEEVFSNGIV